MTVEEIFTKLATHMREGILYHELMAQAYDFIGLWGFSKCQVSHCLEEKRNYQSLLHYYSTHYYKLLPQENVENPKIIPDSWYKYTTQEVDTNTKRNSVKELMFKWVEWEKATKVFYQSARQDLTDLGELAAAMELDCYIADVTKELTHAEKKRLKLETSGYDIYYILDLSDQMDKKYTKKLGW